MATPANDSIVTDALSVRMGRYGVAWRDAMSPLTWAEIPMANTIASLDPEDSATHNPDGGSAIYHGSDGQVGIVGAWSGAVLDPATDTLIVWGGGHTNYGGNEHYKARLDQNAPMWSMPRPPSGAGVSSPPSTLLTSTIAPAGNGYYYDGRPRSQHTYQKLEWVPGYGMVVGRNSGGYQNGQLGDNKAWLLGATSDDWSELSNAGASSDGRTAFCWDEVRNRLWRFASDSKTVYYLPFSGSPPFTWGTQAVTDGVDLNSQLHFMSTARIAQYDLIALLRGRYDPSYAAQAELRIFDPVTNTVTTPTLIGTDVSGILLNWGYARFWWVPELGCLCGYDNEAGYEEVIVTLTPTGNLRTDPWTKGILTPSAANTVTPSARPGSSVYNGTYGRFAYSSRLDGFYMYNGIGAGNTLSRPVYFFALS